MGWQSYDTKPITIELHRWDPVTATASSLMTTGVGIVGSAKDIVVKPIHAYQRPKPPSRANSDIKSVRSSADDEIYGRPAALELPPNSAAPDVHTENSSSNFVHAVAGSASGVGGFFKHFTKGMYLDMPLAVAEGMRNAPKLYGGEVYDPGVIKDWKSGGIAAGKNFSHGIVEGFGGLVTTPMKGAKKEGAAGAAKGVGVGILNLGAKVTSGKSMVI